MLHELRAGCSWRLVYQPNVKNPIRDDDDNDDNSFLSLIILMSLDIQDTIRFYWSTSDLHCIWIYSTVIKRSRLQVLRKPPYTTTILFCTRLAVGEHTPYYTHMLEKISWGFHNLEWSQAHWKVASPKNVAKKLMLEATKKDKKYVKRKPLGYKPEVIYTCH